MKKIITLALTLLLTLSLAACSAPPSPVYTSNWGKNDVLETSTYSVYVEPSTTKVSEDAPSLTGTGTYVQKISGSTDGYTLETTFSFEGNYSLSGTKIPVSDSITSKVVFGDVSKKFNPTSSEKTYNGKTVTFENGNYKVDDLSYSSKITYGEKSASVEISKTNGDPLSIELPKNFEIALPKTTYFDNEMLFAPLRGYVKTQGSSLSFSLISPFEQAPLTMHMSVAQDKTTVNVDLNGEKDVSIDTLSCTLVKSSPQEAGTPIQLFFAMNDLGEVTNSSGGMITVDRSRLIKMQQIIPYTTDNLTFELTNYTYGDVE